MALPEAAMTTSHTLRGLFEAVQELPLGERAAFLDAHCADTAERDQVERMFEADADLSEPVSSAEIGRIAGAVGDAGAAMPAGSRIGPFELVALIGEGGSSTVFRATREAGGATQEVALKLMRQSLHSPEARRRFRREQRALIRLHPPNIARMLEGGVTDTGLPYIALERDAHFPRRPAEDGKRRFAEGREADA